MVGAASPLNGAKRSSTARSRPLVKLTGLALSTYMNAGGEAFPAKRTLAARTGLAERTIFNALRELEAAGLLVITPSKGRSSSVYSVPATMHALVHGSDRSTVQDAARNRAPGRTNRAAAGARESLEGDESLRAARLNGGDAPTETACFVCEADDSPLEWYAGQWWCATCVRDYRRAGTEARA